MIKLNTRLFISFFITLIYFKSEAQIAGSFTVPGSFPTVAAAVTTLNTLGIAGPVTINVVAGHTETVPVGGIKLFNVAGASPVNQIYFAKQGVGVNPLLTAYTGGTATPADAVTDGVWCLIGADFITIDGIDIMDPNTTNPSTMEYGYAIFKRTTTNGCQYNTIKNCTVTLRNINGDGSSWGTSGSVGINLSSSSTYSNYNSQTAPASAAGCNYKNRIYNNLVKNCHTGIALIGGGGLGFYDASNDIGGSSAATSNTVLNFGGSTQALQAYGVKIGSQDSLNFAYNVLNNNNGGGLNPGWDMTAVSIGGGVPTISFIKSNTITLSNTNASSWSLNGIDCLANGTVNIVSNVFPSYSFTNSSNPSFYFIKTNGAFLMNVSGNLMQNVTLASANPTFISTFNGAAGAPSIISSNTITNVTGSTGTYGMTWSNHSATTVSNNLVSNITLTASTTGFIYGFVSDQPTGNNSLSVLNNTITNIQGRYFFGIHSRIATSVAQARLIDGNTISNVSQFTGGQGTTFTGIYAEQYSGNSATTNTISANKIYSITSNGTNTTSAHGNLCGIYINIFTNGLINGNKIYGLFSNTAGTVQAITLQSAKASINNNIIGDLRITNSSQAIALSGIAVATSSTLQLNYNSIYLYNAVNNGTNSGSSVLTFSISNNYPFSLNNNIFINTSQATGSGISTIIRGSGTVTSAYAASSNRNLFYIGTPSANNVIYRDAINTYSTLFTYKAGVAPREANSVTELPPFISTIGSAPNTLSINPAVQTQVESGAAPIASITTDYGGTTRNVTTPDIGAWEGNFTQADVNPPQVLASGFTGPPCNTTSRTFTATLKDTSGVASGSVAPRVYYKVNFSLYTSVQGVLSSGTPTLGTWTFNLTYAAAVNDVISYFLAAQDASALQNLTVMPSPGSSATDVNNIIVPPSPPFTYTINSNPTISISVSNTIVCSGANYTIVPSGAVTYSYLNGGPVVTPTANTNYSVTGFSQGGCPSTNTAVASISVQTSPTVSSNSGSICAGQTFTIVPSGAISYTFSGGSSTVTPATTSTYAVVGTNSLGCTSNTAISTVTVINAGITASASSNSVCPGNTVVLNGNGGSGYSWTGGVTNNVAFTPSIAATYTVSGTGQANCFGTATIQIGLFQTPTVSINASSDTLCVNDSFTLNASGASNYTWNPGSTNGSQVISTASSTTIYTLSGVNSSGCSNTTSMQIVVDPCTGLKEFVKGNGITIYPNPSSGNLTINSEGNIPMQMTIYNSVSQEVMIKDVSERTTIYLDLPAGIYTLKLRQQNILVKQEKLIIIH
jgi:hypothetical protein